MRETRQKNMYEQRLYQIVNRHKHKDIKSERYDANNHFHKTFIEQLFFDQHQKCIYCKCELMTVCAARANNLLSIKRIDNSIGHIKSNCVLSCLKCNVERKC